MIKERIGFEDIDNSLTPEEKADFKGSTASQRSFKPNDLGPTASSGSIFPYLDYSDRLYDILEWIHTNGTKEVARIAFSLIELERDPNIKSINALMIKWVDTAKDAWTFDVTINGKVEGMKIGQFVRYYFPQTYSREEIYNFCLTYSNYRKGIKTHIGPNGEIIINPNKITSGTSSTTKGTQSVIKYSGNNYTPGRTYPSGGGYGGAYGGGEYGGYYGGAGYNYKPYKKPMPANATKIELPEFKYNPRDVRATFLSLTSETYPHGHETEVLRFLPELSVDKFGNYYKIIGKSETMFTCHIDTASHTKSKITHYSYMKENQEFLISDGTTILGADDKGGATVLLYLMSNNVPGVYYFFIGEERGGIGSHAVARDYDSFDYLKGLKRCVSFDRRNYYSIITDQMGVQCCSDEFGKALADDLNRSGMKYNLDPTGVYTDSASFIDHISECTNVSIGYQHEHTTDEFQNITFLDRVCKAAVRVNWEALPTVKRVGIDEYISKKYRNFLTDFKLTPFHLEVKLVNGFKKTAYIQIEVDNPDTDEIYLDMENLSAILTKHNIEPDVLFDDEFIKIELK